MYEILVLHAPSPSIITMAPKSFMIIMCTLLTFSVSFLRISAMDYLVTNLATNIPGGMRLTNEIGIPYTQQIMGASNEFIWSRVFEQYDPADQKPLDNVSVYIVELEEAEGVSWGNNKINISTSFLEDYEGPRDLKWQFASLMYHEMTHVFQWDGEGTTPDGLIEGIADYTKLVANYAPLEAFAKPGDGNSWDQGYDFTARFLEYCDGIVPGFVAKLNKMMRYHYDVTYFQDLTGKTVDQLWMEYKAKYEK